MGQHRAQDKNLLAATAEMVDALVSAAKFKQAIEEDQHKSEIYSRLADVLRTRFEFRQFTIYEVSHSKNRMVAVAGDPPDRLPASTVPPFASTNPFTMDKPSPAPPVAAPLPRRNF